MSVVVFLPNWIGDVTMATPALRALRARYANTKLIGVMRPYVAEVLAGLPWLDERILYHPRGKDPAMRSLAVVRELRARKPELAVLLPNSLRAAAMAWASGAKRRVGFARYGRGPLLTHKLYHPRVGRHYLPTPAIDCYLQVAYAAGCDWEPPRLELATLAEDERGADAAWQTLGLPAGERVVTLNSGGSVRRRQTVAGRTFRRARSALGAGRWLCRARQLRAGRARNRAAHCRPGRSSTRGRFGRLRGADRAHESVHPSQSVAGHDR